MDFLPFYDQEKKPIKKEWAWILLDLTIYIFPQIIKYSLNVCKWELSDRVTENAQISKVYLWD